MGFHTSYAFSAPADLVFDTLTDLSLINGWLPEGLSLTGNPDGTVEVHWAGGGSARFRLTVSPDQNRLAWTSVTGSNAWSGGAVVCDLPVCGSVIQVRLTFPDSQPIWFSQADLAVADVLRRVDAQSSRVAATVAEPEAA